MNVISVRNEIREYPDDGGEYNTLIVRNHWNKRDKVVLELGGKSYVFVKDHIIKALTNASNAH